MIVILASSPKETVVELQGHIANMDITLKELKGVMANMSAALGGTEQNMELLVNGFNGLSLAIQRVVTNTYTVFIYI
jgi:hypothetical protein